MPEKQKGIIKKDQQNLTELKSHLKNWVHKDLKKAIEQFQSYLKPNASPENDLISLLGRYNGNQKQILSGTITNDEANRIKNQIRHALLSYIDDLEEEDIEFPKTSPPQKNIETDFSLSDLEKLEKVGLKEQAELLIKKLNFIKNALFIETDANRQFQYQQQIGQLEKQLAEIKKGL